MKFRIKEARERVGLSQKELAKILKIKPTTFNGYETGAHDPKSDVLARIAKACGTTVDYLLGLESVEEKEIPAQNGGDVEINAIAKVLTDALLSAGLITADKGLSPNEVDFLAGIAATMSAFFDKQGK